MDTEDAPQQAVSNEFYLRYYNGHRGHFGHEFVEFEIRNDGLLRYANNSNYKKEHIIRKEVFLNDCVVDQLKTLLDDAGVEDFDDSDWPEPNLDGRQELEIKHNGVHMFYVTCKLNGNKHLQNLNAGQSLRQFYLITSELRSTILSLINLHFRLNPVL